MKGYVYIITNDHNTTLYTGVSTDLFERINQHKKKKHSGSFTARYNVTKLVHFECFDSIGEAIKKGEANKSRFQKEKVGIN